ncbi:hypothetical protein AVEN_178937-1 [Araneus ventricosus]|uniref:Uncharacterized protein n=1 Tax=Araneus ventricosus TaxID=182803 RepID=A0A4Y2IX03_ARAVE|nr:hypothetical protein AVEN_178937-1 [Araneus ventricosus]
MFIQLRVRTSSYVRRKSVPNAQPTRNRNWWKDDVDIQIECGLLGWDLMFGLREFCARVKLNSAQKTEAKAGYNGMAFTPWVTLPGEKTPDVHRPFHPGPPPPPR